MPAKNFINVNSSNIEAVCYEREKTSGVLTVRFKNQETYAYSEVEPEVAIDFIFAVSPGKFLAEKIKPNYPCKKLEAVQA